MFQIISWTSAFPPKLGPAMCGVIRTFSIFQRGDVSGNGSISNTSRTAPFYVAFLQYSDQVFCWNEASSSYINQNCIFFHGMQPFVIQRLLFPVFPGDSRSQYPLSEAADPALSDHIPHQTLSSAANAPGLQFFFIPVTCVSNAFILWAIFLPISLFPG